MVKYNKYQEQNKDRKRKVKQQKNKTKTSPKKKRKERKRKRNTRVLRTEIKQNNSYAYIQSHYWIWCSSKYPLTSFQKKKESFLFIFFKNILNLYLKYNNSYQDVFFL